LKYWIAIFLSPRVPHCFRLDVLNAYGAAWASSNTGVGQQSRLSENKKKKQQDTHDAMAD
jgi:hypothetical protein